MKTKQMNGTLSIINKSPNILSFTQDVSNGLTDISAKIEEDKKDLANNLEKIKEGKAFKIKGVWVFSDKSSIERTFNEAHSDLRVFAEHCVKAFCSLNDNVSSVLQLLQCITKAEQDLYTSIDKQSIASNELRSLIIDYCRENNIKDEDVEKLLNASIQRAYTLRDRIENLRNDYNLKIGQNKKELEDIKHRISESESEIPQKISNAIAQLEQRQKEAFNGYLSQIQERVRLLEKSQEVFIEDHRTQEEKRVQEQKALISMVEESTRFSQTLKKQVNIYKVISIGATGISIASLLYVFFT